MFRDNPFLIMASSDLSGRRFSEKQVGALLRRASELQDAKDGSRKLAFDEVEHIAEELGIDPEHLRAAALEQVTPETSAAADIFGGPFARDTSRRTSVRLEPDQWIRVILSAARHTGSGGSLNEVSGVREWTSGGELMNTHISVVEDDDGADIHVSYRYRNLAIFYMPVVIFACMLVGVFLDGKGLPEAAIWGALFAASFGGALAMRTVLESVGRKGARRIELIADDLRDKALAQGDATRATVIAESGSAQGLETIEIDEEEVEETAAVQRRRSKA